MLGMYKNALNSPIHNCRELETTQMPVKYRMNKQLVVQSHNGLLCNHFFELCKYNET